MPYAWGIRISMQDLGDQNHRPLYHFNQRNMALLVRKTGSIKQYLHISQLQYIRKYEFLQIGALAYVAQ